MHVARVRVRARPIERTYGRTRITYYFIVVYSYLSHTMVWNNLLGYVCVWVRALWMHHCKWFSLILSLWLSGSICLARCCLRVRLTYAHTHTHTPHTLKQHLIYLYRRYAAQFGSRCSPALATIKHLSIHLLMGYLSAHSSWCACVWLRTTIICILLCITTLYIQSPYYWIMNINFTSESNGVER